MDKPFTFSPANHRMVANVGDLNTNKGYVLPATGILWVFSVYKYQRRYLRVDKNMGMAMFFVAASLPASYSYARLAFGNADQDAAEINNANEAALKTGGDDIALE